MVTHRCEGHLSYNQIAGHAVINCARAVLRVHGSWVVGSIVLHHTVPQQCHHHMHDLHVELLANASCYLS